MVTIHEIWSAYQKAHGRWSGCDWPTHFGSLRLDLEGISSLQAHRTVRRWRDVAADDDACPGAESTALSDMALHLNLRGTVTCVGVDRWSRRGGRATPTRRACAAALAREWEVAAFFLTEIEADARSAEREGFDALRAAQDGDWSRSLRHARGASLLESGYFALHLWGRLEGVIEAAAGQAGFLGPPRRREPIPPA